MRSDKHPSIAVLGTGIIGAPIARNLHKQGFPVRAWNRTESKAHALSAVGVEVCETPADAVRGADIIVTTLKDGDSVLDTMRSAAPSLKPGLIWAQLSTVGVKAITTISEFASENGLRFFDAPVQGTRQPAENAQLVILASGPVDDRSAIQPVFDAIGKRTVWVAEEAGASSRLKLALNSWAFALTHGVAESLSLAGALGIDPALVVEVVTGGAMDSDFFQAKAAAMLTGNYAVSFSIANALKDARLMVDAASYAKVQVDGTQAGLRRFERAFATGHGDKDMAATYLTSL